MQSQERQSQETGEQERARDRIVRAAVRLYPLHGYKGTSMREIAEAAGVTKPLIYYRAHAARARENPAVFAFA